MTYTKPLKVQGRLVKLDETRMVFVGLSDDHPNHRYIVTRNADGDDTYLVFNEDAAAALSELLSGKHDALPVGGYPHKPVRGTWRLVTEEVPA